MILQEKLYLTLGIIPPPPLLGVALPPSIDRVTATSITSSSIDSALVIVGGGDGAFLCLLCCMDDTTLAKFISISLINDELDCGMADRSSSRLEVLLQLGNEEDEDDDDAVDTLGGGGVGILEAS
jgi:hypothetical protein